MIYKLAKDFISGQVVSVIKTDGDKIYSIPFDPDNTDYTQFKKDIANGAELLNSDGEVMTNEQIEEFMRSLA